MPICACVCEYMRVCVGMYMHKRVYVFWFNINTYIINEHPPGLVCKLHMPNTPTQFLSPSCAPPALNLTYTPLSLSLSLQLSRSPAPPPPLFHYSLALPMCACLFMCVLWLTASVTCQCSMLATRHWPAPFTMSTVQRFKSTSSLLHNPLPANSPPYQLHSAS